MSRISHKLQTMARRKFRIRAKISGTTERPRLTVFVSNKHISAQIIDDSKHHTLVQISTVGAKSATGSMTERAAWVGQEIAKKAKSAKIKRVVFDRNGKQYHGRIKALAEAARAGGLEF